MSAPLVGSVRTEQQIAQDRLLAGPRQRVSMNRAAPLTLDGTWQPLAFTAGSSTRDMCTFPESRYDFVNQKLWPNPNLTGEQSYRLSLSMGLTIRKSDTMLGLSLRLMVPADPVDGGPVYGPLPDSMQRVDLPDQLRPPGGSVQWSYPVYANALVRKYGAQVQIRATSYQITGQTVVSALLSPVTTIAQAVVQSLSGANQPQLTDAVLIIESGGV